VQRTLHKNYFQRFWSYHYPSWAGHFLDNWITRTLQGNLEPMKEVANTIKNHKPLILDWFKAQGRLSSGAVEGLNLKAKLTIKKAYSFRTLNGLITALYHTLGQLPEPKSIHKFC